MLTLSTLDTDIAAGLLRIKLPESASDRRFLEAVTSFANRQPPPGLEADHAWLVEGLGHAVTAKGGERFQLVHRVATTLIGTRTRLVVVWTPPRFSLSVQPRVTPDTARGVVAYALALLLDEDLPHGRDLCRCKLPRCGRFFMAVKASKGRTRRNYCTDEHMLEAQKATASKRASESRARRLARERRSARRGK